MEKEMKEEHNKSQDYAWLTRHIDTIVILGAFASSVLWMNGKFNTIEQDLAVVKTVLIMKNIMPAELCKGKE